MTLDLHGWSLLIKEALSLLLHLFLAFIAGLMVTEIQSGHIVVWASHIGLLMCSISCLYESRKAYKRVSWYMIQDQKTGQYKYSWVPRSWSLTWLWVSLAAYFLGSVLAVLGYGFEGYN